MLALAVCEVQVPELKVCDESRATLEGLGEVAGGSEQGEGRRLVS